jgi:maltooligosyltrehalose trehalohydrolase
MSWSGFGARLISPSVTEFRLWAPEAEHVSVAVKGVEHPMHRDELGVFAAVVAAGPGDAYKFWIDNEMAVPDPASRLQKNDVHGESVIVDPSYDWKHTEWVGRPWHETVIYEVHAGAYGGFAGITAQLPRLAALGITAIELMPIADFPGRHNWGYDGVLTYAPDSAYGTIAALKQMIDTAHGLKVQVFLDVVYNHFGPDGNYLNVYAKSFFRDDVQTPWGSAIDFRQEPVRRFFIENALYWLHDYRFDGLRFDAVHAINDRNFLAELATDIRAATPMGRHIHLIVENEHNDAALLGAEFPEQKFDAQWTDDWHHCVHVLLTGETEGYYGDFLNPAEQLARCMREGFAYQGEASAHADGAPRGTPSAHLPSTAFVICLQNHDQIGNRALGERLTVLANPQALSAAVALLLLTPQIPMLFMGEEWGETKPFLYFTDHNAELGKLVREGRRKEFAKFVAFTDPERRSKIPDPNAPATFAASCPTPTENDWTALYKACLKIRREQIIPRMQGCKPVEAVALSESAIRARWRMNDGAILTIAANFGATPLACDTTGQGQLFTTSTERHSAGILPAFTTTAWLEPA